MSIPFKFFMDIFYPNKCPCCGSFIRWDKLICGKCHRSIEIIYDKTCKNCGKEVCICSENLSYDGAASAFRYEGIVREGILSLKRGNNKNFGEYAGKLLAQIIKQECSGKIFDFVVPVPMSASSYNDRGYNQAEIIAREISSVLDIPVKDDILFKSNTSSQHYLKRGERMKNISAIKIKDIKFDGASVIICDDVITTGSTINRCASLLKAAGCENIFLAAAAQSKSKN